MATQNPTLPVGQWVSYNATTQDPRAPLPSPDEQGIGIIRQAFTQGDGNYYQVVWNPGAATPKSALYHENQLNALTQQAAQQQAGKMNDTGVAGSAYQQPAIPTVAAPPANQQPGMETL